MSAWSNRAAWHDEETGREVQECPLCTETVTADEDGMLDCQNCGCHLESKL